MNTCKRKFLSPQELAELYDVSADFILRLVEAGRLPHYRLGDRSLRFDEQEVRDALRATKGEEVVA